MECKINQDKCTETWNAIYVKRDRVSQLTALIARNKRQS